MITFCALCFEIKKGEKKLKEIEKKKRTKKDSICSKKANIKKYVIHINKKGALVRVTWKGEKMSLLFPWDDLADLEAKKKYNKELLILLKNELKITNKRIKLAGSAR